MLNGVGGGSLILKIYQKIGKSPHPPPKKQNSKNSKVYTKKEFPNFFCQKKWQDLSKK
jgi:hypothetical protein